MPPQDKLPGRCKAAAFDVFDTLLHRDVAAPADVFAWMEARGHAPAGFAQNRRQAEAEARAAAPGREVTLAEIYARPRLAGLDPAAEIAAERALCVADRRMLALVERCRAAGMAVYAVSDMYLPADAVRALLDGCGFGRWDGVFVSSEYGVQKRSGRLFRVFLQSAGLRPRDVVFFGDDRRADSLGAALAGVHCVHTPGRPPLPAYLPDPETPEQKAMYAWLANRAPDIRDGQERFGFTVLGPLAVSFAAWLQAQAAARPGSRLVLLARDMALVREACRLDGARDTAYLRVSRKSLCPALLMRPMTPQALELLAATLPGQLLRVDEILAFCGFAPGTRLPGYDPGLTFDLRRHPACTPESALGKLLCAVSALSRGPAGEPVRCQAAAARAYLSQFGLERPGTLVVDLGSGGTTQRILQELCGCALHGLYLACDGRLYQNLPRDAADVFLFGGQPAPLWYWMAQPILEYLISEPVGATTGYRMTPQGPAPVQEDASPPAELLAVQRGALRFAREWAASPHRGTALAPDAAIAPFLNMARRPRMEQAACFGDFVFEDGVRFRLAAPRTAGEYLRRPAALAKDFSAARWKVGFLKRLFRLPLPYDGFYALLKRLRDRD